MKTHKHFGKENNIDITVPFNSIIDILKVKNRTFYTYLLASGMRLTPVFSADLGVSGKYHHIDDDMMMTVNEFRKKPVKIENLGEKCSLIYRRVLNWAGSYHPVDMVLKNEDKRYIITDSNGYFVNFPGVEHGDWEKNLSDTLEPKIDFVFSIGYFSEGRVWFSWMVQPDGRYWEDEDGFGSTNDREIWLYSYLDKNGNFTQPFSDKKPEKRMRL